MTTLHPFRLTKPCPKCPFRRDIPAYLNADRVRGIVASLEHSSFACHVTVSHGDDGDDDGYAWEGREAHCAGALIMMERAGRQGAMMQIAERLGLYDPAKLDMDAPVYDTFAAMIAAQPRR